MKWLTRPSVMALASVALVVGAAMLVLWPPAQEIRRRAVARRRMGDRLALYGHQRLAWERFVAAVRRAASGSRRDTPTWQAQIGDAAFPKQTTAVPGVALPCGRGPTAGVPLVQA